jgi:hypothetical protein
MACLLPNYMVRFGTTPGGIPFPIFGAFLAVLGLLGLAGVNVFYGGPFDKRKDRPAEDEAEHF